MAEGAGADGDGFGAGPGGRGQAFEDVGWQEGDVLVVGSSALGPIAQVFLGSRATKILRHSPVPVVVVPRARAEKVAESAARA